MIVERLKKSLPGSIETDSVFKLIRRFLKNSYEEGEKLFHNPKLSLFSRKNKLYSFGKDHVLAIAEKKGQGKLLVTLNTHRASSHTGLQIFWVKKEVKRLNELGKIRIKIKEVNTL